MTLTQATESVFHQLTNLLENIDDQKYSNSLEILNGNSIGKHVRHIVEFYECLCNCSSEKSTLDYDLRKRNLVYETNTNEVIHQLEVLLQQLKSIQNVKRNVDLYFLTHPEENQKTSISTTIERELAYNLEHTIHHMAIIRIAVNIHFKEIYMNDDFGIAPSTIKYLNSNKLNESVLLSK